MPPARRPEPLRGQVFRASDAISRGLVTRNALRSRAWRRLHRDVFADALLPDGPGLRIAAAALLVPAAAVFSGRTAAWLLGAEDLVGPATPVEVTVPPDRRFGPVSGIRIRQAPLPACDVRRARGHRCTTAGRTAIDLARFEPLEDAVPALDVLLHQRLVLADEIARGLATLPPGRGTRRARQALGLADARAESPQESRLRMLLQLAGLPPVPQYTVRTPDGRFIARVDLAYPEHRVAVEYDGAWHADTAQFRRDRRRLNALVAAGWTILHVTASDLREPEQLVGRVRHLLTRGEIGDVGLRSCEQNTTSPNSRGA